MSKAPPNETIQAQVEQLTTEAKKLSGVGKEAQALDVYRKAAELMPGAPWLQNRTAELARKLRQPSVAAQYYRRAGAAFIGAGFPKRALGPLRNAWTLLVGALPANPSTFISVTLDLAELQRELGFAADGALSITSANEELRAAGCIERAPELSQLAPHRDDEPLRASDPSVPPQSRIVQSPEADGLGILARFRLALKS